MLAEIISIEIAFLRIVDKIKREIDDKEFSFSTFLEFSKAFDADDTTFFSNGMNQVFSLCRQL